MHYYTFSFFFFLVQQKCCSIHSQTYFSSNEKVYDTFKIFDTQTSTNLVAADFFKSFQIKKFCQKYENIFQHKMED